MADLFANAPARPAVRLAQERVRTLPALLHTLQTFWKLAGDQRHASVNLADVDPLDGATVSLNRDDRGVLYVQFEGLKR